MKVSAIAFDWTGVIWQNPAGNFNDAAAAFLQIDNERFRRAYYLHNHAINKGSQLFNEAIEMWGEILTELGMKERLNDFMVFVKSRPEGVISKEIVDLIRRLKERG